MEGKDLREQARQHLKSAGMSQVQFAHAVGIAESTFSRWLSGNYPGDAKNVESKVTSYLEKEEARQAAASASDIRFAWTGPSRRIWDTLDYCRAQRQIVCIYGDAGVGKTFTAREWMKDKPDVIFLNGNPAFNSPKSFLKLLARTLKVKSQGNKDDLFFNISENLTGKDVMLIIDEAQHFNVNTIEMIRGVQEETHTGLALIGNAVVYSRLQGKQQAEFAQLFSRLLMRDHVLTDQFRKDDVLKVFGALDEGQASYLLEVCRSRYGLRGAVYLYMNALNNENTSEKGLRAMAAQMGVLV